MIKKKEKIEVSVEPGSENLVFSYSCLTDRVSYSISDMGGTVCLKGKIGNESTIKIDSLSKGIYVFCIVDGDALTKVKFRKD